MRVELNEFSSSYFNANSVAQQIHSRIELKNKPSNKNKEEKSFSNNLYSRFQQAKKNKDMKKQASNIEKIPSECSFKPQIRKLSGMNIQDDVIKRNQLWLKEKQKRNVQRKQDLLMEDLDKCTFSPDMVASQFSKAYIKNKSQIKVKGKQKSQEKYG